MAKRKITVFYAWQSDRDTKGNQHFIRKALDDAAKRINEEGTLGVEVKIDADTEGVVGTPPVDQSGWRAFNLFDKQNINVGFSCLAKSIQVVRQQSLHHVRQTAGAGPSNRRGSTRRGEKLNSLIPLFVSCGADRHYGFGRG